MIAEMTEGELRARIGLGRWLIAQIADDPDPRSPGAAEHYRGQVAELQAEIDRRGGGAAVEGPEGGNETKPKDVVIAMDTLSLTSQLGKTGG